MKHTILILFLLQALGVPSAQAEDTSKKATTVPVNTVPKDSAPAAAQNPAVRMPGDYVDPFEDWDPFQDMSKLQARVQRLFNQSLFGSPQSMINQGITNADNFQAAMDVAETPAEVIVTVDVPGIPKEDLKVEVKDGILTVGGDRRVSSEEEQQGDGYQYRMRERSYGSFQRSMKLPDNVDASRISAEHEEGILTIRMPKIAKEESKPIKVNIQ